MTDAPPRRHNRAGLFAPFIIAGLALCVWTVWWFVLARQVDSQLDVRAEALRQAGWRVEMQRGGVGGWPFRVRTEARAVVLTAPSGHALAAPALVAEANAYKPDRWMVVAPDGLTLTRGAGKGRVAVRADAIRASVHGLTQRYPNLAVELANAAFTPLDDSQPFPLAGAERIEFYMRPHPTGDPASADAVDVLFRLVDAEGRENGPVAAAAQGLPLTAQIETTIQDASRLRGADAAGVFAAWTRADGRFTGTRGEIRAGDSRVRLMSETLTADGDGRLDGVLSLSAVEPLPMLTGLIRAGFVRGDVRAAAALTAAPASSSGEGGEPPAPIALSVAFRNGRAFLGPFALGPSPRLF